MTKHIAIVGAGPAGLMAAEVLSQSDYEVHVFEQKPSAARKFLMAGKTGLNISHAELVEQFVQRYDQVNWLEPWIKRWDAIWIQNWMRDLGIEPYIGSSGRVFPTEMKAAPLLRAWLKRLTEHGIQFHYRHQILDLKNHQLQIHDLKMIAHSQKTLMRLFWLVVQCHGQNSAVMGNGKHGLIAARLNLSKPAMRVWNIHGPSLCSQSSVSH